MEVSGTIMGHETATLMTCKQTGIYQAHCKRHNYPKITLRRGDKFPACPPVALTGEGRGHIVDWELIKELDDFPQEDSGFRVFRN